MGEPYTPVNRLAGYFAGVQEEASPWGGLPPPRPPPPACTARVRHSTVLVVGLVLLFALLLAALAPR